MHSPTQSKKVKIHFSPISSMFDCVISCRKRWRTKWQLNLMTQSHTYTQCVVNQKVVNVQFPTGENIISSWEIRVQKKLLQQRIRFGALEAWTLLYSYEKSHIGTLGPFFSRIFEWFSLYCLRRLGINEWPRPGQKLYIFSIIDTRPIQATQRKLLGSNATLLKRKCEEGFRSWVLGISSPFFSFVLSHKYWRINQQFFFLHYIMINRSKCSL